MGKSTEFSRWKSVMKKLDNSLKEKEKQRKEKKQKHKEMETNN